MLLELLLDGVCEVLLDGVCELLLPDGLDDDELLDGAALLPEVVDPIDEDWSVEPAADGDEEDELDDGEELDELDDAPVPPFSAASVCWSSCPLAVRLFCCWNCLIAASVFGPIFPSTVTSMPLSFSACWAWRTSELLADCDELVSDEPDCDDCEEVDCWELDCEALLAPGEACEDDDDLSLASTAVLESASAAMTACASFMCIPFRYRWAGSNDLSSVPR